MSAATARLVDHALSVHWDKLPPPTQQAARTFLHDTICVGVAGRAAPNADRVWHAARNWAGEGRCPILGRRGEEATAPYAAFMNAFQIHAQEFDCVHEPAVAHPLATVVGALLAEASRSAPVSGADFLTAMVAGVDVIASLGIAVTSPLKFFRPATAGIFGSVAAIARLRRLSQEVTTDAFGHALAFAAGTMQAHVEGKPTLALQVAAAARSAIEAIDLAVVGLTAPLSSIDGPFGYLTLFEDEFDLEPALQALGRVWRIDEVSWKPFPTGRAAHGAIVAVQQMMTAEDVGMATLERLEYRAPPLIARLVGRRPFVGMDAPYARLCFAWLGAVVLERGTVGLEDFTPTRLSDPRLHALAERISVIDDGNLDPAAFVPALARAALFDGRSIDVKVEQQFGSPAWPLTREQHLAKASACLTFGGLSDAHEALAALLDDAETAPDIMTVLGPAFGRRRDYQEL